MRSSSRSSTSWRDPRSRSAGQAALELALALPVVLVLVLAVVQVALVARAEVAVTHASREAARAVAVGRAPSAAADAAATAAGLDPARVEVTVAGVVRTGAVVTVSVRYRAPTDVAVVGALVGDIVLESSTSMLVE